MVKIILVYLLIFVIGFGPLISAFLSEAIANSLGCTINEGQSHDCTFRGREIGHILYGMFVVGWLAIFTFPSALVAAVAYTVYLKS